MDDSDLLERFFDLLRSNNIAFCVIGGQAVNAYADPVVSLDLDLVVALEHLPNLEVLLTEAFAVKRFPHSIHVSVPGSDLRIQIQTDERYFDFVERAAPREVLGFVLPVADVADLLQGKVWAAQDTQRRASKRQKDLADIARLPETYPVLRARVPEEILRRLF